MRPAARPASTCIGVTGFGPIEEHAARPKPNATAVRKARRDRPLGSIRRKPILPPRRISKEQRFRLLQSVPRPSRGTLEWCDTFKAIGAAALAHRAGAVAHIVVHLDLATDDLRLRVVDRLLHLRCDQPLVVVIKRP